MPDTPRRSVQKSYHHGNLREALLDAAVALLARQGAERLTIRDVARAAKVSHAAPYHHFAGLDDLLAALAERAFVALASAMERAAKSGAPRERLIAICQSYVAFGRRQPALFRLMFGPTLAKKRSHAGLKIAAERAFQILLGASLDHDPKEGRLLALTGWSVAHGLANLSIDGALDALPIPVPDSATLARAMAERLLTGPPTASMPHHRPQG